MSYVRWGDRGSDVYVIGIGDGRAHCVGCFLAEDMPGSTPAPEGWARTFEEMVAHLEEHVASGQVVPGHVFERLAADIVERDRDGAALTPEEA